MKKIYIGKDILDRKDYCYKPVKIDKSFPQYIYENQKKYSKLILKQNVFQKIANSFVILNCKLFIAKKELPRNIKKLEKSIRRTLSPLKKAVLKIFKK